MSLYLIVQTNWTIGDLGGYLKVHEFSCELLLYYVLLFM